jgi:hypothetical protein
MGITLRSTALKVVALLLVAGLPACKGVKTPRAEEPLVETPQRIAPTTPAIPTPADGNPSQAAGIAWTVPDGWNVEPPRSMRIATYRIHAIAGDPEDAECAIYFFGAGQGGTVDANLDRWAHQFRAPNGETAPFKLERRVIRGLTVSTITATGTYLGGGGMMAQEEVNKPNFRMRGAIAEAPAGLVFFKLVGPLNTVAAAESGFNSMLNSLHPQ